MDLLLYGILGGLTIGAALGWLLGRFARRSPGVTDGSNGKPGRGDGGAADHTAEVAAMTAGLAHEIKNPLSTIGMNAQLLDEAIAELPASGGGDDQELLRIRRRIGTLVRETERLRGILTDFLDFAGEMRLHRVPADLNTVVEELSDFFLPEAEKAGVRMRVELADTPVPISADVPHLKQAVLNLMLNATQAITASGLTGRELILRVRTDGPGAAGDAGVHVTDTGPGMDAEQLGSIFRPYFTTKSGGTGLGLPTAKRIAEAHGGGLSVVSEPGRGTDFVLTVPLATPAPRADGEPSA